MPLTKKIVAKVDGIGLVTSLGRGCATNVEKLKGQAPTVEHRMLELFEPPMEANYLPADSSFAISDKKKTNQHNSSTSFNSSAATHMFGLLDSAVEEALDEAKLSVEERKKMPIFIGSSSYGIGLAEELYQQALGEKDSEAIPIPLDGFSQISGRLRTKFGIKGADFAYNTACTSSANAILSAANSITSGASPYALVVGIELYNLTTLAGFAGMQLLTTDVMRPFDRRRNGLILGEGCSALILKAASAEESDFIIDGGASHCDTYSISASNPDGSEIARVMREALEKTSTDINDIVAIKAHGTASPLNDNGEAAGMRSAFTTMPMFFALKPYIGHTLGGCGAIETALVITALKNNFIPATPNFEEMDETLAVVPITHAQPASEGSYLLNFFGFGGNNSSLVLRYKKTSVSNEKT